MNNIMGYCVIMSASITHLCLVVPRHILRKITNDDATKLLMHPCETIHDYFYQSKQVYEVQQCIEILWQFNFCNFCKS